MRTATAKAGQKVKVGPEGPCLGQSEAKLTGGNMRAERSMDSEPGTDRRVEPKKARSGILQDNESAVRCHQGQEVTGT